jgi:putative nucleotidyltransferase with HDIG domain
MKMLTRTETLAPFVAALEDRDVHLESHSMRVSLYAAELAQALRLSPPEVAVCRRAGLLHDIGKLALPDAILQKPAPLTEAEYADIKGHPEAGAQMLADLGFLAAEADVVRSHHEWYDGAGYPEGLAGKAIPLAARVVSVADVFDAVTTDRPYQPARSPVVALCELLRSAGSQFDPDVVAAFAAIPRARLAELARRA